MLHKSLKGNFQNEDYTEGEISEKFSWCKSAVRKAIINFMQHETFKRFKKNVVLKKYVPKRKHTLNNLQGTPQLALYKISAALVQSGTNMNFVAISCRWTYENDLKFYYHKFRLSCHKIQESCIGQQIKVINFLKWSKILVLDKSTQQHLVVETRDIRKPIKNI